jgi:hypothetical protein
MAASKAIEAYASLEAKFDKACTQLRLLNGRISYVQSRYDKAAAANSRSFRYTLRIELVELEGVRNMYYQYAKAKAEELDHLKLQIIGSLPESGEDDMEY